MNPNQLLEYMEELKAIAASQQNRLTKAEIGKYLSGMKFDEAQMDAVYQYLAVNQITVEGVLAPGFFASDAPATRNSGTGSCATDASHPGEQEATSGKAAAGRPSRGTAASAALAHYRSEISSLTAHTEEELSSLWTGFLTGDVSCRDTLVTEQLPLAMHIAGTYKKRGILPEDLIAEGNAGIMAAMQRIRENPSQYLLETSTGGTGTDKVPDLPKLQSVMEEEIRRSIEYMIHESVTATDRENAILARTNLLHEAAKYLAEENGRTATVRELAEYTRLSVGEIHDIMELSDDTKSILKNGAGGI